MKKFAVIAVICLLLASLHSRADVVVVENISSINWENQKNITTGNHIATIKIKGDKGRLDQPGGGASVIFDANKDDEIWIFHRQKKFAKVKRDTIKSDVPFIADPAAPPKIVDTGKQEKVGEYNTEVYTVEIRGWKCTIWVTKDIPNYASIREQMKKMRWWKEEAVMGSNFLDTTKIDGMPVKMEMQPNDKQMITVTIVSAKEEPANDADFQPPADYTEVTLQELSRQDQAEEERQKQAEKQEKPGEAGTPPSQP